MAVYLLGLLVVVAAVWVFLTQTPFGRQVPSSVALVLILLLVGLGIMMSARSINESRRVSRTVRDTTAASTYRVGPPPPAPPYVEREYVPPPTSDETIVEERRYD